MRGKLFPLFIAFNLVALISYSQHEWFPMIKFPNSGQSVVDSSGSFPVSFIEFKNRKMYMCGYHTNYRTPMIFKNGLYFSPFLTIPIENKTIIYAKAKYYFKTDGLKGRLIINFKNKTETIIFIRSLMPLKQINGKWG